MATKADTIYLADGSFDFTAGVDSSKVTTLASSLNPNGLKRNQLAWLFNGTTRGGGIMPRTGWQPLCKIIPAGHYQGGFIYEPDSANPYLICQISGIVYRVLLESPYTVTDLTGGDLSLHNPDTEMVFFCQGENILVIQAGDFLTNPTPTLPLFWDGTTLRRSLGITTVTPTVAPHVNELPAATCMWYHGQRIWYAQARGVFGGDIAGGPSGTAANHFRDSIISVTENPLCFGGDGFTLPTTAGNIRALREEINLNQSVANSRLLIWTRKAVFALSVPVTRTDWINANATNQPLIVPVQKVNGTVGDRCVVPTNGDWFYQSFDPAVRSLISAVRYFQQWGNTPISQNEERALQFNDRSLMRFSGGIQFNNRLFELILPEMAPDNVNVIHKAVLPLDFDTVTSLTEQSPIPAWEGAYDGLLFLELFQGDFGGLPRAFATVVSEVDGSLNVWELTNAVRTDNGDNRITMSPEFPAYTWSEHGLEFKLKQLKGGECWVDKVNGTVDMDVYYRADADPCWRFWYHTQFCAERIQDLTELSSAYPCDPFREGYRFPIVFPEPPPACDSMGVRPSTIGYQFQTKIMLKGWCRIRGLILYALPHNEPQYHGLVCPPTGGPIGMRTLPVLPPPSRAINLTPEGCGAPPASGSATNPPNTDTGEGGSSPTPPPPPVQLCEDPTALNFGGPLPCVYAPPEPPPVTCSGQPDLSQDEVTLSNLDFIFDVEGEFQHILVSNTKECPLTIYFGNWSDPATFRWYNTPFAQTLMPGQSATLTLRYIGNLSESHIANSVGYYRYGTQAQVPWNAAAIHPDSPGLPVCAGLPGGLSQLSYIYPAGGPHELSITITNNQICTLYLYMPAFPSGFQWTNTFPVQVNPGASVTLTLDYVGSEAVTTNQTVTGWYRWNSGSWVSWNTNAQHVGTVACTGSFDLVGEPSGEVTISPTLTEFHWLFAASPNDEFNMEFHNNYDCVMHVTATALDETWFNWNFTPVTNPSSFDIAAGDFTQLTMTFTGPPGPECHPETNAFRVTYTLGSDPTVYTLNFYPRYNEPSLAVTNPSPINGGIVTSPVTFTWNASVGATSYDVYVDGTFKTNQAGLSYGPLALADGAHTWRIDARNACGITTGTTWSFCVTSYAGSALAVFDNFDRANSSNLGANWEVADYEISSNRARRHGGALSPHDDWLTKCQANTQYARVIFNIIHASGFGGQLVGVNLRKSTCGQYTIYCDPHDNVVYWYGSTAVGEELIESASFDFNSGDSIAVTVAGTGNSTVLRIWKNVSNHAPDAASSGTLWNGGAPDLTFTNNPVQPVDQGGQVGISSGGISDVNNPEFDDFSGGDCP